MSAEIWILVPRFDVGVGIEVRLCREKVKGATLLGNSRHHLAGKAIVLRLGDDEHKSGRPTRPSSRWNTHDARFINLDRQRLHVSQLNPRQHTAKLFRFLARSFQCGGVRTAPWWLSVTNEEFP